MIDQPVLFDSTNTKPVENKSESDRTSSTVLTRNHHTRRRRTYVATGVVANARLSPLLPADWVDRTQTKTSDQSYDDNDSDDAKLSRRVIPDFLWENSPRHETKGIRDFVGVYSHLPNGINILDSKWVLGRIFSKSFDDSSKKTDDDDRLPNQNPLLATCETHCFSGLSGFQTFARSVELFPGVGSDSSDAQQGKTVNRSRRKLREIIRNLPDIASTSPSQQNPTAILERPPKDILNWWVVKDAGANGAGGVWVVGPENVADFQTSSTSPLIQDHKYVAQQYVWPPVLYEGKKCHVRVYVTITCDGRAFVHRRAFLHVANDAFAIRDENKTGDSTSKCESSGNNSSEMESTKAFDDCIHITNCCANSHDDTKFAGEILADFGETSYTTWVGSGETSEQKQQQPVVPLADFFPSVKATVSAVVQKTFQLGLLDGGRKNHGFEYCGMDFMLSYRTRESTATQQSRVQPLAYLLEINSPPSQDTASSLPHAEDLHNEVLRDWMTCWVIPHIDSSYPIRPGGWIDCRVEHGSMKNRDAEDSNELILPSKAAMLNKIRWALFERKIQKRESANGLAGNNTVVTKDKGTQLRKCDDRVDDDDDDDAASAANDDDDQSEHPSAIQISRFARSQFPFFSTTHCNNRSDTVNSTKHTQEQLRQQIFFENAGGAQVPKVVVDHVAASLSKRHREEIGRETKAAARETLRRILVGDSHHNNDEGTNRTKIKNNPSVVVLGLNATSLLVSLANHYSKLLKPADEVVVSTENHLANFDPWIEAATNAGAKIKLWAPLHNASNSLQAGMEGHAGDTSLARFEISSELRYLVTPQTRLVAIPHASNVLGSVRPISQISKMIKDCSNGYAHVVVDGVAVAPHAFVGFDDDRGGSTIQTVDWYVVSMHKLFGPHIGVLLARQNQCTDEFLQAAAESFGSVASDHVNPKEEQIQCLLEWGTANIEGCAGVVGLGNYFKALSDFWHHHHGRQPPKSDTVEKYFPTGMVSIEEVRLAYRMIRTVETSLVKVLFEGLSRCPQARILEHSSLFSKPLYGCTPEAGTSSLEDFRLPTVSFVHERLSSREIYTFCQERGIICRNGFFLCTRFLAADLYVSDRRDGVFRVSLAHYNTAEEVEQLCETLESIPGWFVGDDSS